MRNGQVSPRWVRLSTAAASLVLVFTPGCAKFDEIANLITSSYHEEIEDGSLNPLTVQDVEDGTALAIRFYGCYGDQYANAYVGGLIDTIGGNVHGLAKIEDVLRNGTKLEGILVYKEKDYLVEGEFLSERARFKATIQGVGDVILGRVEAQNPDNIDREEDCE